MEKDLNSGCYFFDPSANRANMLFLGDNNLIFPGQRTMMSMEDNATKKRPFLTSPDEIFYDEEYYYDEAQLTEKKRRLSPEQVVLLEKSFEEENKLEPERKGELAKKLGLQPRQVAVWFQNRRARLKTKQIEREYEVLKASYDSLRSDYDSLVKENAMIKTELHSINEKIKAKEKKGMGPKANLGQLLELDGPKIRAQEQLVKVEDGQSSGSGGGSTSAVENGENQQMAMDSTGDSCLGRPPTSPPCMAVVQSKKDDVSDDGRSYFSNMLNVAPVDHHHGHEEGQELGWWVWS